MENIEGEQIGNPEQKTLVALRTMVYRVERFLNNEPMHDGDDKPLPTRRQREEHSNSALAEINDLKGSLEGRSFLVKWRETGQDLEIHGIRDIIRSYEDGHLAITFGFEGIAQSFSLSQLGQKYDIYFI